jgi:uncharacterized protein YjbI with pentapeptide repeats
MATKEKLNPQNIKEPYVGPRPYEEVDKEIFFGREKETTELASLIIAHPIVLLYSQSGAGKTSLLKASLIPLLKRRALEVLPITRVRGQITNSLEISEETNIYTYNAIGYLTKEKVSITEQERASIKDYLPIRITDNKREIIPIRVLIFDQFEEIFTTYPERFENRQDFFEQISDLLKTDPLLRIVLSMREDYIAELDPYAPSLPEKLGTRYRLMRLDVESARDAIEKPFERINQLQTIRYFFEPEATDKIVDSLRAININDLNNEKQVLGPYIEPVQLQVVCQTLWRKLQSSFAKKVEQGDKEFRITTHEVETFGNVMIALIEFYEQCLLKALRITNNDKGPKITERILRGWFSKVLITPESTRSIIFSSRKDESVAGIPKSAINEFENQRLIRAELRGGEIWYELSHDRFIQPILKSNEKWLQRQINSIEIKHKESGVVIHQVNASTLVKADLSGLDLQHAYLSGMNLRDIVMQGTNLSKANLSETNLIGADLRNAILTEVNLSKADLSNVNLEGAVLDQAVLIGADLSRANLSNASLRRADLSQTRINQAKLNSANLEEAYFNEADIIDTDLNGAKLYGARMHKASLSNANLKDVDLSKVDLSNADLSNANLDGALLIGSILTGANIHNSNLRNCSIYGISAWDLKGKPYNQTNLIITPEKETEITVDDLQIAQFVYLLLKNENVRNITDAFSSKAVLILGRFTSERKVILDALREELRKMNFAPILFDFEKPRSKDITETIQTLASMARFIIADLTDPSSILHELATIIPIFRHTPVLPIKLKGANSYSIMEDLQSSYPWVLKTYEYKDAASLIEALPQVVESANKRIEAMREKL